MSTEYKNLKASNLAAARRLIAEFNDDDAGRNNSNHRIRDFLPRLHAWREAREAVLQQPDGLPFQQGFAQTMAAVMPQRLAAQRTTAPFYAEPTTNEVPPQPEAGNEDMVDRFVRRFYTEAIIQELATRMATRIHQRPVFRDRWEDCAIGEYVREIPGVTLDDTLSFPPKTQRLPIPQRGAYERWFNGTDTSMDASILTFQQATLWNPDAGSYQAWKRIG